MHKPVIKSTHIHKNNKKQRKGQDKSEINENGYLKR
jgi:hypothetical protein